MKDMQKCWDCAKASGGKGCPWADEGKPVPCWTANEIVTEGLKSMAVTACPEFVRDSWGGGMYRLKDMEKYVDSLEKHCDRADHELEVLKNRLQKMRNDFSKMYKLLSECADSVPGVADKMGGG